MHELERIKLPRLMYNSIMDVEFVGFCNASNVAYYVVIYARSKISSSHHITIVASETKFAPIHKISLPRLELCGANLLK